MKQQICCAQCGAVILAQNTPCQRCAGSTRTSPESSISPSPSTHLEGGTKSSYVPGFQGSLSDKAIAETIREANVDRRTGILHLERQGLNKRIYFDEGSIVFANSDSDSDRLGQFLIRSGKIDESMLSTALQAMKGTGRRFGRTVVELGVMNEESMTELVAEQIREIVASLFEWDSGNYGFEPIERPVEDDVVVNLSTADIMLSGVRRMSDTADFRGALSDLNRVLRYSDSLLLTHNKITLSPEEGFVLSRVDGTSTINEILTVSPLSEEQTLRCIYGLILTGVLETEGEAERRSAPSKKVETKPRASEATPEGSEPENKKQAVPRSSDPSDSESSTEEKVLVEEISSKLASIEGASLYDILGVSQGAGEAEIKTAYYGLAKKFHPDRHHYRQMPAVRERLEELFLIFTEAYHALSNPGKRRRYDGKLQQKKVTERPTPKPAVSKPTSKSAPEPTSTRSPEAMAENWFQKGKDHYYKASYFTAVQCLREAVRLDPEKSSYRKLLARALTKNPKWRKEAESHYRHALKKDQFDLECYLGLAEIYEVSSLHSRAMKMYQIVLGFDPDNKVAGAKLYDKSKKTGGLRKLKDLKNIIRRQQD